MDDGYSHMKKLHSANQENSKNRAFARSKEKLKELQNKRIRTTFIGALDKFEKFFGDLWGHGKPFCELSETEIIYRKRWDAARTAVLDNGNAQIRALSNELEPFQVLFQAIRTDLKMRNE